MKKTVSDRQGAAFLKGCPDGDSDGIADKDDKVSDRRRCCQQQRLSGDPERDRPQITKIASKIFFETGSDKLKTASDPA